MVVRVGVQNPLQTHKTGWEDGESFALWAGCFTESLSPQ